MAEPDLAEWPWEIRHGGHVAWYQRALMPGDFAPGQKPVSNYVVQVDGELPEPHKPLKCGVCGKVPKVQDLTPVDRMTGNDHFLREFRVSREKWPPPTDPETCWNCNVRSVAPIEEVDMEVVVKAHTNSPSEAALGRARGKKVKVCHGCSMHFLRAIEHRQSGLGHGRGKEK
jgi:hypothetical protein